MDNLAPKTPSVATGASRTTSTENKKVAHTAVGSLFGGVIGAREDSTEQPEVRLWEVLLVGLLVLSTVVVLVIARKIRGSTPKRQPPRSKDIFDSRDNTSKMGKILSWKAGTRKKEAENGRDGDIDLEREFRKEQPWIRDQRLANHSKRHSTNPFERQAANPFDSDSSSASTPQPGRIRPRPLPLNASSPNLVSPGRSPANNPFDDSTASSVSTPNPGNPFNSSPHGTPTSDVRPMDAPVSLLSNHQQTEMVAQSPLAKNRRVRYSQQKDSVGSDSLQEFFDTSDETGDESSEDDKRYRQQRPHHLRQRALSSVTSGSHDTTPSNAAKKAAASLAQSFHQTRSGSHSQEASAVSPDASEISRPATAEVEPTLSNSRQVEVSLELHELCDEARTTDDVAWRNALFLLSTEPQLATVVEPECSMLPLHVCCLAVAPPPVWLARGLFYANKAAASQPDAGGRLPLHLVAATTADIKLMQLLVEEYPPSVSHADSHGFIPLHLLLRNDQVQLTLEHVRILLGQTLPLPAEAPLRRLQRRGDHLNLSLDDLQQMQRPRHDRSVPEHDQFFDGYPDDVRHCLNRIVQWKRAQIRKGNQDLTESPQHGDYPNPASLVTPTGKMLPLHILVRRGTIIPDQPELSLRQSSPATLCDLLRVLIGAYPEGLVEVDSHGRTPLMTALLMKDSLPSEETVELLLGRRTPGYQDVPGWASDLEILQTDRRYKNPAMISVPETQQLPLHIAAEEALSNYSLLAAVCEAYPPARLAQDIRGRTPLHLALGNYQNVALDVRAFELLYSSEVARAEDGDGLIPFDLVVRNQRCLKRPTNRQGDSQVYQEFFCDSIGKPRSWRESQEMLRMLGRLPHWLRRHTCAAEFVKDLLIERLASPFPTAAILLNGCVLVALISIFRLFIFNDTNELELKEKNYEWCKFLIYALAGYRIAGQLLFGFWACLNEEFWFAFLRRFWHWVDLVSASLAVMVVYMISSGSSGEHLVWMATATTGLLWLNAVGFLVQWCHGMAIFIGVVHRLISSLVWPCVVGIIFMVAFSQMFFTMPQLECIDVGGIGICKLQDAFRLVYILLLGQPVVDVESQEPVSRLVIVILAAFTILATVLLLGFIVVAVMEAVNLDRSQIGLEFYWEPKLSSLLNYLPSCCSGSEPYDRKIKIMDPPSCMEKYCLKMESLWNVFILAFQVGDDIRDSRWYGCCSNPSVVLPLRVLAFFVLPLWFIIGILSFGFLWPPQVRRWLLRPKEGRHSNKNGIDREEKHSALNISGLKREMQDLKSVSYQQSKGAERELRELKQLILLAMNEE